MSPSFNKDLLASAIKTYRLYGAQPILSNVEICNEDTEHGIVHLTSNFTMMDLIKLEDVSFTRNFVYSTKARKILTSTGISTISKNVLQRSLSPDGKYVALVTKEMKGEQELQQVQIWQDEHLIFAYDINDSKICPHGKILPSNNYGSFFEWSPDSRRLIFTAVEKRKTVQSYFTAEKLDDIGEPVSLYRSNWGEQMEVFESSIVCLLDLDTKTVKIIDNQPADHYFGQCTWTKNPDEVILVSFRTEPYRLGLIYCENRQTAFFKVNHRENTWIQLNEFDDYCRLYPRFLPNQENNLVYFRNDIYRGHQQCHLLVSLNIETKEEKILIDRIENVTYSEKDSELFKADWDKQFKGLYLSLPKRSFSSDGRYLVISSYSGSRYVLYLFDLNENKLIPIESPRGINNSIKGIGIIGNFLVTNVTDCRTSYGLYLFDLRQLNNQENAWHFIGENQLTENDIQWSLDRFFPDSGQIPVESIYVRGKTTDSTKPLMVLIHGGPNSLVPVDYYIGILTYIEFGFDMLIVNYRGSIGFGQASVDFLLGKISKTDVSDCHQAIRRCLDMTGKNRQVVLIGGSHAGVIIGRLIGEYPDDYAAAVLRNPVTDFIHINATSDIPDWLAAQCLNKSFKPEDGRNRILEEDLVKMMVERSSIEVADKIKAPVLLQLGKNDKRVPCSIGMRYYEYLKGKKVPVKLFTYESNHALSEPATASDCFVNTILFLDEHLKFYSK